MKIILVSLLLVATATSAVASSSCLTKSEARKRWPDAHLYWYNDDGDRCWSNRRGKPPVVTAKAEKPAEPAEAAPVPAATPPSATPLMQAQALPISQSPLANYRGVMLDLTPVEPEPGIEDADPGGGIWPVLEETIKPSPVPVASPDRISLAGYFVMTGGALMLLATIIVVLWPQRPHSVSADHRF